MGQYSLYVWSCYIITFGLLGLMIVMTHIERRKTFHKIMQQLNRKHP